MLHIRRPGGTGEEDELLGTLLAAEARAGLEVRLALPHLPELAGSVLRQASVLGAAGVAVEVVPAAAEVDPRPALRINEICQGFGPEVVHCHDAASELLGTAAAGLSGVPVVSSRRGGQSGPLAPVLRPGLVAISALVRHFIADSAATAEGLVQREGIARRSVSVVPPAMPERGEPGTTREQLREEWGLPPDVVALGAAGPLRTEKGLDVLLEAFARFCEKAGAPARSRVVLAGWGPEEERLREQLERLRLGGAAMVIDSRDSLADVVEALDVVVVPSRSGEPGLTCLTAMAAAKPVLASAVDTLSDLVAGGVTGVLVPPGNSTLLSEAIESALAAPERLAEMGRMGRVRAATYFDADRIARETLAVYRRVAASHAERGQP